LQIGLPGLEVGDLVRYVARERTLKTRVPNTWCTYQTFEGTSPLKHTIYEVSAPKALPLRTIALKSPVADTVKFTQTDVENNRTLYRWEVTDVPRTFMEPNMPDLYTVVQRLLLSTTPDWQTLSKWYCNLSEPHLKATPAMQSKVAELTSGLKSDEEKVNAIFHWASHEIRYMGITTEAEAPGYEPHDASMTFENRHGVCRDKAALLVTLLRAAGLKSWPTLIMAGAKKDEEVPTPYFNHAIVCWEKKPGEYVLMDPTNENTKDIFPTYLCNRSYLVAKPEGETLRVSGIVPAEKNLVRIESKGKLDAAGNLSCLTTIAFDGINDTLYRGAFIQKKPEELRRYFEGLVKAIAPGATLTSLEITPSNFQDTSKPLSAKVNFEAKDLLVRGNGLTMLTPPRFGASVGVATQVIGQTGLEKRKYMMDTEFACGVRESLRLELDPAIGNVESLPEYAPVSDDIMSVKRTAQLQDNGRVLVADSDFLFKAVEVNPAQYLVLKGHLKEMEFDARKRVIFKGGNSGVAADMRILSKDVAYDVQDGHNWTVTESTRYQVLTYKGKKENSELRFLYNPAWESVELE
ncbi:TPA: hypothetical protein DDW35_12695, partial [Candidatus Sumerlaeota bacterium]|nr:hypothetical protein [Candidatus Sumerlaeota bacterium]